MAVACVVVMVVVLGLVGRKSSLRLGLGLEAEAGVEISCAGVLVELFDAVRCRCSGVGSKGKRRVVEAGLGSPSSAEGGWWSVSRSLMGLSRGLGVGVVWFSCGSGRGADMTTLGCCRWTRCTVLGVIETRDSLTSAEGPVVKPGDTELNCFGVLARPGGRGPRFLDGIGMLDLETSPRPNTGERRSLPVDAHACRLIMTGSIGLGDLVGDGGLTV